MAGGFYRGDDQAIGTTTMPRRAFHWRIPQAIEMDVFGGRAKDGVHDAGGAIGIGFRHRRAGIRRGVFERENDVYDDIRFFAQDKIAAREGEEIPMFRSPFAQGVPAAPSL